ncbi:MAG: phosphate acyltransferase [bacterium]
MPTVGQYFRGGKVIFNIASLRGKSGPLLSLGGSKFAVMRKEDIPLAPSERLAAISRSRFAGQRIIDPTLPPIQPSRTYLETGKIVKIDDLVEAAKKLGAKSRIVVVGSDSRHITEALKEAHEEGLIGEPILIKNDDKDAATEAVKLILNGQAEILLKGTASTATVMKAVLGSELKDSDLLSFVSLLDIPSRRHNKLTLMTDTGLWTLPWFFDKKDEKEIRYLFTDQVIKQKNLLIENALAIARLLGIVTPKIGLLTTIETPTPRVPETLDTQNISGSDFGEAIVEGPMDFSIAVSPEAAKTKKWGGRIQGDADILVFPDINAGNIFYKSVKEWIVGAKIAHIIVGAKVPIIITSRDDSAKTKLHSIALALLMAEDRAKSF